MTETASTPRTFGVLVFDGAEELDFVGPWEVITASAMVQEHETGRGDRAVLIAENDRPIRCNKGMRVLPDATTSDHPDIDVLLVPGGNGTRREATNTDLLAWIAHVGSTAEWVTSACTGSLLLVASGVARDRNVATHWAFEDTLEARGDCTVIRDQRWVRDGNIVTSQGVSAGIDMALWLLGELYGPDHARTTRRYIQYDPAPPF